MSQPDALLAAAEDVVGLLKGHGVDAVVIGAVALAAYHYVRQTEDLDLAVNADLAKMRAIVGALAAAGYTAEFHPPDSDDPLAGVIDVRGPFGLIQIISFSGRFPAVVEEGVREAELMVRAQSSLRIVPLPHLIALKLYAGGYKSKADILELLARNPAADVEAIKALCRRYRLAGLDELLRELR